MLVLFSLGAAWLLSGCATGPRGQKTRPAEAPGAVQTEVDVDQLTADILKRTDHAKIVNGAIRLIELDGESGNRSRDVVIAYRRLLNQADSGWPGLVYTGFDRLRDWLTDEENLWAWLMRVAADAAARQPEASAWRRLFMDIRPNQADEHKHDIWEDTATSFNFIKNPNEVGYFASGDVNDCVVCPTAGDIAVSGSGDGIIRVWSISTRKERFSLRGHTDNVTTLAISDDAQLLVSGSFDTTVRVWDLEKREQIARFDHHAPQVVLAVALSPDSRFAASVGHDKVVRIWRLYSSAAEHTLSGHTGAIYAAEFSPDGSYLVTAGADGTIRVWDYEAGRMLREFDAGQWTIESLDISRDGRYLAAGGSNVVSVWDTTNWALVSRSAGFRKDGRAVVFSPDGRLVVSGGVDKIIWVRNTGDGTVLHRWYGHRSRITGLAYSPDGSKILSSSWDDTVRVWTAP